MKNNTIVTLADANYFELLNELIDSIKNFTESENISICVLDAGLSEQQKDKLKAQFHHPMIKTMPIGRNSTLSLSSIFLFCFITRSCAQFRESRAALTCFFGSRHDNLSS